MRAAARFIAPSRETKQALRLRRFGVAAFNYVLATALAAVACAFGVLPLAIVLQAAVAFLAINFGFYGIIRSGFNLRFADPSLTRLQMLAAISVLMYIVYHMDQGRNIGLFGCFIVFLFGIFRLGVREFIGVTLYTLAAYAVVINLLMHLRPQAIHDVPSEWMSWLGLAGFLPCFVVIGGQINALRRRMRESEACFRSLIEMSSDFYWETDARHRLTDGSAAAGDDATWRAHRAVLEARRSFRNIEGTRLAVDGSERHISISGDPAFDAAGAFLGYRGVGTDITERKRSEQILRDSADELRLFAENIPAMTASWDEDLRCCFANKAFAEFFCLARGGIVGRHVSEIVGGEAYPEIRGYFAQALQGRQVSYQRACKLPDGELRYLEIRLLPHRTASGDPLGCFSVTTDITEHKLAQDRIQRVAHHDNLTGLPNRLLFSDRLNQAIGAAKRDSRQFALLYLDLDRFKPVNDTLGHAAGDELLIKASTKIRHEVRESDTVARVGGDEFTVILRDIAGRAEAESLARKILAGLAEPFLLGKRGDRVSIGASIGIALYPADASDADALIKAADAAMYGAKQLRHANFLSCAA